MTDSSFSRWQIGVAIAAYSGCSSTLLLMNKTALSYLPYPGFVSVIQLSFATAIIFFLKGIGKMEADDITWDKTKPFIIYTVTFVLGIFANMQCLNVSNVETVIVCRSIVPIGTTVIEYVRCPLVCRFSRLLNPCYFLCIVVYGA